MDYQNTAVRARSQELVNGFVRSVYNWMAGGLAITGLVAFYTANSPTMVNAIVGTPMLFFGLIIAELVMVFTLSARIYKMQAQTATALFIGYAVLNGLTLSVIFLAYTSASITSTFFICAATFAACSVYGYSTKRDLTSMGGFMFMGLIGIIIASLVNIFLKSPALYWTISYIGVVVFVGLTAYDTQKIKNMARTMPADVGAGAARKGAIMGALALYLDFINLFLMLLRIFGDRR
ncbi:MAG: Bax inhibitor-1/YccA family protein [Thermodesulfobacteriota bacterium]